MEATETTIAEEIRSWRRDIADTLGESTAGREHYNRTAILCYAWNWATAPFRPMTEREHRACRRLARRCRRKLAERTNWYQAEDGRLRPSLGDTPADWRF